MQHARPYAFRPVCGHCGCAYDEPDWRRPECFCGAEPVKHEEVLFVLGALILLGEAWLAAAWLIA